MKPVAVVTLEGGLCSNRGRLLADMIMIWAARTTVTLYLNDKRGPLILSSKRPDIRQRIKKGSNIIFKAENKSCKYDRTNPEGSRLFIMDHISGRCKTISLSNIHMFL